MQFDTFWGGKTMQLKGLLEVLAFAALLHIVKGKESEIATFFPFTPDLNESIEKNIGKARWIVT